MFVALVIMDKNITSADLLRDELHLKYELKIKT